MTKLYDQYGQTLQKEYTPYLPGVDSNGNLQYYNISNTGNFYSTNPTLFRAINLSATVGSSVPVQLYSGDTLLDVEQPISGNAIKSFELLMPAPNMSLKELMYRALTWFFYRGEYMVRIHQEPVFYLEPLNPKQMTKNTAGDWVYRNRAGTSREVITDDELVYLPYFDPDHDRGRAPAEVLNNDLINDQYAVTYNTETFKNFGPVGGILKDLEGVLTAKDMERLVELFNEKHAGSSKAGKTLGLPKGIDYDVNSQTMREMEFGESRDRTRDTVALAYGIHKALLGVTDQVNRSVSEEATRMFILHTVKPQLLLIEDKFNQTLFRQYFPNINMKFNFDALQELKETAELKLKQAEVYRSLGYTINEINERFNLGMEEVPDEIGNTRLIPSNFLPADDYGEPIVLEPAPTKDYGELAKFVDDNKVTTKVSTNYLRKYKSISRATEKRFKSKMSKFFSTELGQVLKFVYNQKSVKEGINETVLLTGIMEILNESKKQIPDLTKPIYDDASYAASSLAGEVINSTKEPEVAESVVAKLVNRITNTSNHTYRLIRTQVKDGVNSGETIDQIADRIKKVYKMSPARSRTIARTETATVINQTTDKRYTEGGVERKKWLSVNDATTRPTHAENDALGEVDYNFTYPNGQKYPNDGMGGASENVNCRCTFVPVI